MTLLASARGLIRDRRLRRGQLRAALAVMLVLSVTPTAGAAASQRMPELTGSTTVSHAENRDDAVGTYTASGLAAASTVWSVSGDAAAAFRAPGGVLAFDAVPDYEQPADLDGDNDYEVTVTATDASASSASIDVTVTVTDVNDPSIVLIMADDVGYESFGAYGSTQYDTPRLDEIAAEGCRFTRAYSKPVCSPTRVALMTGKSNVRNYVDWAVLRTDEYTFADLFSDAGYATAIGGKWQLHGGNAIEPGQAAGRGFDAYCLYDTALALVAAGPYWNPALDCDGELVDTGSEDYGPDIIVDFLLDFIESNRNRPFFAYYPMLLPHFPYVLPPGAQCADPADEQCIFEKMVERADHNVGHIYDKLDDLGLLDNTVLLFTSDNGAQRKIVSHLDGRTIYGDKKLTTDGGTLVPLIAHVPGQTSCSGLGDLIDTTDIFPTLAEAAGIDIPDTHALDGVSFWEQLQGYAGQPREWIYTYYFPRPYRSHYDEPSRHPEIAYAFDKRYKLYSTGEMFDYATDRLEIHPLPSDDPDSSAARTKLQAALDSMPAQGEGVHTSAAGGTVPGNRYRPIWRPLLRGASVNGSKLALEYVGVLRTGTAPPRTSFAATVDGTDVAISAVDVSTTTVTLTLDSDVTEGQQVTVIYEPGADPIQHANRGSGRFAAPLSDVAVVNNPPHNDPPSLDSPSEVNYAEFGTGPAAVFHATDPQGDMLTWSVAGTDAEQFQLSASGVLSFAVPPDYESPSDDNADSVYAITVTVSDGKLDRSLDVTVTVTNVDEPGSADLSGEQPQVGTTLTATLTDADGVLSQSWSWQRSHNLSDWSEITGADSADYTPAEIDVDRWLRATVSYEDGHGAGKQAHRVPAFKTSPPPVVNNAPVFGTDAVQRSIQENAAAGRAVGAAVTASDPDDDMLAYTLSGPDTTEFALDSTTGQITVGLGAKLDYEARSSYVLTLQASDRKDGAGRPDTGIDATATVTIEVVNVDEPGRIPLSPGAPRLNQAVTASLSDPDRDITGAAWSWQRADSRTGPWTDVPGAVAASYTPTETDTGSFLRAVAFYEDGEGPGKRAEAVSTHQVAATTGDGGGFGDIPEDAYYSVPVSTLVELGVFVGTECEAGFCPGDPIDRKTMAVWIVRVLDGEDPAAVSESRFHDVDASGFHAPFIERMAELEVTRGCGDGTGFCPDRNMSRAEMAAFLSRAHKLPEGPDPGFVDVPAGAWYAADVAKLAASKITVGCGDGSGFCPGRDTTRAHMATFLYRAENRADGSGDPA